MELTAEEGYFSHLAGSKQKKNLQLRKAPKGVITLPTPGERNAVVVREKVTAKGQALAKGSAWGVSSEGYLWCGEYRQLDILWRFSCGQTKIPSQKTERS